MADTLEHNKEMLEKLELLEQKFGNRQSWAKEYIEPWFKGFNNGLANSLGASADMGRFLMDSIDKNNAIRLAMEGMPELAKKLGLEEFDPIIDPFQPGNAPFLGSAHINKIAEGYNLVSAPEDRKGFIHRLGRITGETAIPFTVVAQAGKVLKAKNLKDMSKIRKTSEIRAPAGTLATTSAKRVEYYTELEKMLITTYNNKLVSMGIESIAITAGAYGGELAEELFPESQVAGAIGEILFGIAVPVTGAKLIQFTGSKLPISSVLMDAFSKGGANRRAGKRTQDLSEDVDRSIRRVMEETILDLDPMTLTGDEGLYALYKAAITDDHKLLGRMKKLTTQSMDNARNILLASGDPQDAVDYLKSLRMVAATEAQEALMKLDPGATPVESARVIREIIQKRLTAERGLETEIWNKIDQQGKVGIDDVTNNWEEELTNRVKTDDPEDLPDYLKKFLGDLDDEGVFQAGTLTRRKTEDGIVEIIPSFKEIKVLKTRIDRTLREEFAKDAKNWNRIRILKQAKDDIFNSLMSSSQSGKYEAAVTHSRNLNQMFTEGKVGKLLGYSNTGEVKTSFDGTLEFMLSGNKDSVREGIRQLALVDPEAVKGMGDGIKAMFIAQAAPEGNLVNVKSARTFLRNNEHILAEFPEIREGISRSIKSQKVVDEWLGNNVSQTLSTFQKDKAVTALYLNSTPESAMFSLVSAKNAESQGAMMHEMLSILRQDPTGRAIPGFKTAFGQYLIRSIQSTDTTILSGKKLSRFLGKDGLEAAAKVLYTKEEFTRLKRLGTELTRIEERVAAESAKGGMISDVPNMILNFIGRSYAARAGGWFGGKSTGANLRTASVASTEFNKIMKRLTNDGAEQILLKAVEDKEVLTALLKNATLENTRDAARLFNSFLTGQAITYGEADKEKEMTWQEKLQFLEQQREGH